jgi:hypothetical protein
MREASEVQLHSNKLRREDGFCGRKSWKTHILPAKSKEINFTGFSLGSPLDCGRSCTMNAIIRAPTLPNFKALLSYPAIIVHCPCSPTTRPDRTESMNF